MNISFNNIDIDLLLKLLKGLVAPYIVYQRVAYYHEKMDKRSNLALRK